MCGIAGIVDFTSRHPTGMQEAVRCLALRGPDNQSVYEDRNVSIGHARLSVIDVSESAGQPMQDESGRYVIAFNGEFFNFAGHRRYLEGKGISFRTNSDTEVLLQLYILEKEKCLERVNGFFAFAVYDREKREMFIARDRMGVKPLLYYADREKFVFASELKAMTALGIPREMDPVSVFTYFQLNYIPGPQSIYRNVLKLEPGHYMRFSTAAFPWPLHAVRYYSIPRPGQGTPGITVPPRYEDQQRILYKLMEDAVQRRLISDVPLGCFLSGGIDSSVITALAAKHTKRLKTFSIGFRDEPGYDETRYANSVSKMWKTDHTVFSLTTRDLYDHLFDALNYFDEPFADSSALNVYVLSRETRKHVTVALSGDGADEMFGGYNKHAAELMLRKGFTGSGLLKAAAPLLHLLPQSRQTRTGNLFRQASRLASGLHLNERERYWRWAGIATEKEVSSLLPGLMRVDAGCMEEYNYRKSEILRSLREQGDMRDVLYTDMHLVLVDDMLVKVDMMSMANSLEVRVPFLDYTVVDFALSLPEESRIDRRTRKKIVKDTFRKDLPQELYTRSKQGFEVPLLKWFRKDLHSLLFEDVLEESYIRDQGLFHYPEIQKMKKRLHSNSPGDVSAKLWALLAFQHWYRKHMS